MVGSRCANGVYVWTNTSCSITVQVHEDGLINLVDTPPKDNERDISRWGGWGQLPELRNNSKHTFRVRWDAGGDGNWPKHAAVGGCASAGCASGTESPVPTCRCEARRARRWSLATRKHKACRRLRRSRVLVSLCAGPERIWCWCVQAGAQATAKCQQDPAPVKVHLKGGDAHTLELTEDSIFEVERFAHCLPDEYCFRDYWQRFRS